METKNKKFISLKIVKDKGFEIKEEPMAQINAVIKKLKKKQKIKSEDLTNMFNEKNASLLEKIERNNIEIENYKTIIFQIQQSTSAKDHEIEELTSIMLNHKKKAEELEKKINEKKDDEGVGEIKKENEELKKENEELKKENEELKKGNEELKKGKNEEKNTDVNYINETNELNKKENEELKKVIEELKKENEELKKENKNLKKEKEEVKKEKEEVKKENEENFNEIKKENEELKKENEEFKYKNEELII